MAAVNKVILVGRVGKDPEIRHAPSGDAVANLSVATSESWKDKSGEKQERTEWHKIVVFGKLAEIIQEYLKKGSLVYFEGSLRTRKWTNKEGAEQYTTEIVADKMQMLGGGHKDDGTDTGASSNGQSAAKQPVFSESDLDDDIAF